MEYLTLNTNIKPIKVKTIEEFNKYVDMYSAENDIILTKSNNISQRTLFNLPASLTWKRGSHFEFQYIDNEKQIRVMYNIKYEEKDCDETISHKALNYFEGILDVIPTDDVEEDVEIFKCPDNILNPNAIYYEYVNDAYKNMTIDNCYSLDRNSSFLASMLKVYPQTKPWVDKYYNDKLNGVEEIKQYDKIMIGWLNNPSKHRHKAWKKIISDNNKTIHELREKIEANGNEVLLVNTDAVKFIGKYDYQGSRALGDFKYEWENTKMYIKGVKSYAYLNRDKWEFKQAGKTKLDEIKPRSEWTLEEFKNKETIKIRKVRRLKNTKYLEEYYG